MKDLTPEDRKRLDQYNRQVIEEHQKEYFPVRYSQLILFDIIPVDRRGELASRLRPIVTQDEENMSWIEKKGHVGALGGGWSVFLSIDGSKLPKGVESARVAVGQRFGFCLYFLCSFTIAEDTQESIKEEYMKSELWSASRRPQNGLYASLSRSVSDRDSSILRRQNELEAFLSMVPGIFLARPRTSEDRAHCPSIRVLETSHFETGVEFEKWFREHTGFLRFLGLWPALSTFRDVVFSYQTGVLDNSELPAGLAFVKLVNAVGEPFPVDPLSFVEEYMVAFLLSLFWCRNALEFEIPPKEKSIDFLNERFRGLITKRFSISNKIIGLYNETVDIENSFETFALGEMKKLREMQGNYHLNSSNLPSSRPLEVATVKVDVLKDLTRSVRFIADEAQSLTNLRRKVRSLTSQYKNYSEFTLQRDMMRLTKRALFVGLASLLIALVALFFGRF